MLTNAVKVCRIAAVVQVHSVVGSLLPDHCSWFGTCCACSNGIRSCAPQPLLPSSRPLKVLEELLPLHSGSYEECLLALLRMCSSPPPQPCFCVLITVHQPSVSCGAMNKNHKPLLKASNCCCQGSGDVDTAGRKVAVVVVHLQCRVQGTAAGQPCGMYMSHTHHPFQVPAKLVTLAGCQEISLQRVSLVLQWECQIRPRHNFAAVVQCNLKVTCRTVWWYFGPWGLARL